MSSLHSATAPTLAGDCSLAAMPTLARFAVERAPFGITLASATLDSFGRFELVNPAYAALLGYPTEELRGRSVRDVLYPEDLPDAFAGLQRLMAGEVDAIDVETRLRHRNGSAIWVRQHRSLVRDETGAPFMFVVHTEDISERRTAEAAAAAARHAAEAALRESEARYRLIADNAADMIVRTRADRTRAYVSPASQSLLGFEPHEIMETDFATFLHPDDRARVSAEYARFIESGGSETHTYRLRRRDGRYVWVEAHWVATPGEADETGAAVISVVRDISERKAAEAQIALMACQDPLTSLPNRLLFNDRLAAALKDMQPGRCAAVLSIDVDNFKGVNDTFGHAIGDGLLRAVAERIRSCSRRSDTVARLGGDEFAVVKAGLQSAADAAACGERLVAALNAPYVIDGGRVIATASVGIAVATEAMDADTLMNNADVALYRAKGDGRNTFRVFEPQMDLRVRARRGLECELRQALLDKSFLLHYQPIVDLGSKRVVAFEALLRWNHPQRGLVAPSDFIPAAEQGGFIVELGARVLREACRQARTWPDDVRVCVNLSPAQFGTGSLVETIAETLHDAGLRPGRLDLEITESVLLQENDRNRAALHALRALGVGISLDDFGTGYSSLAYLRSFPFDRLKIDRSFVRDVPGGEESKAIVKAVIRLARTLGIATVAEGVETHEQLTHLAANGCTEAQGYLFSRPQPKEAVPTMLADVQKAHRRANA